MKQTTAISAVGPCVIMVPNPLGKWSVGQPVVCDTPTWAVPVESHTDQDGRTEIGFRTIYPFPNHWLAPETEVWALD